MNSWQRQKLDPVTFEVLKNAFVTLVDQMSEQILRTCYSFVIYNRDFSSCICDAQGNTVMQGTQDIAVHVGTLHLSAKAVLEDFQDDIFPGDVFLVNDPYRGGTHFCDVRVIRPVFYQGEMIALMQSNGHWADVGGSTPGSFDINATEHFGEGLRIPPVRVWEKGEYKQDVANLLLANMRLSEERLGDLRAQAEATRVGEQQLLRLIEKYGKDVVLTAFEEVQDYVERVARSRIASLPDGTWEAVDYIDMDPRIGDGLIPIRVKMSITGDQINYDLSGTHSYIGCFLNATFGSAFSGIVAGTKNFFPDVPLNSGFYRVIQAHLPENTVVNAPYPAAVTGFCSGAYEKIMNAIFELWSHVMPERALACCFNLEYLLIGGWDEREGYHNYFMWYDWMAGGHGGRNGKDGANAMSPLFGLGLSIQPVEGQERLTPVVTTRHQILVDSGGPGKFRGGCGVEKGGYLTQMERSVMSYCCDRSRSVTWGLFGGLPSNPHGASLNPDTEKEHFLGTVFSNIPVVQGDSFIRPSAGGGGLGDPLERNPELVLEDVIDGYVSIDRARKDYGVIITCKDEDNLEYELDEDKTANERKCIRENRKRWISEEPHAVVEKYRRGEIDELDVLRRYGVIMDKKTNTLLPKTTEQYREMMQKRTVSYWS